MFLLNQVKVRENQRPSQQLQLRFKGLSDFYVPYMHTYSSVPLALDSAQELIKVINEPFIGNKSNPFFPFRNSVNLVQEYFNIVQIDAPRRLSKDFQKLKLFRNQEWLYDEEKKAKKIFRGKYFDRQARWNLKDEENYLQPGCFLETDDWLVDILQRKNQLDKLNAQLEFKRISDYRDLSSGERGSLGRKINELRLGKKFHPEYDLLMEQILQKQNNLEEILEQGDLFYNKRKKIYELFLDERPKLEFQRQLTLEEWMGLTIMYFDIETPKFRDNDYDVTQVSACITKNNQIEDKVVFNKEPVQKKVINDHRIFSGYETDRVMIGQISNYALLKEVDIFVAYNINFDSSMLNQRGEFYVGEAIDKPKKEVTKKFFERIRVDGGFVIDQLKLGQTLTRGFSNAKLEMVSRFFKGMKGYRKKINYAENAELQYYTEGKELSDRLRKKFNVKDREDAKIIGIEYVSDDTVEMPGLMNQPLMQKCLGHLVWMANNFKLSFPNLTYSPTALREPFNRGYFKHMGIQRDEIYPKGIKWFQTEIDKNKQAIKDFMNSHLDFPNEQGTFHSAERRMVATGYLIRNYLSQKTHTVKNFMEYIENMICEEHEFIFLSHYVNGLADYVLNDFGDFLRKEKAMEKSKLAYSDTVGMIHRMFERNNISYELALGAVNDIVRGGFFDKDGYKKVKARDLKYLKDFNRFRREIDDSDNQFLDALVENNDLTTLDLYKMFWVGFNYQNSVARNYGNHLVHPYRMKKEMEIELNLVKEKLSNWGKLLGTNAPYIYVLPHKVDKEEGTIIEKANRSELIFNCPCQNVIDVYISDKAYSKEEDFYKGIKIKDGPAYYVNAFYSKVYSKALDAFWEKDYEKGISEILKGYDTLRKWNVENEDLLFFNKSQNCFFGYKEGNMYKFRLPGEVEDDLPIHEIEDFSPDVGHYVYDFSQRMKKFAKPVLKYVKKEEGHLLKAMVNTRKPRRNDDQLTFDWS